MGDNADVHRTLFTAAAASRSPTRLMLTLRQVVYQHRGTAEHRPVLMDSMLVALDRAISDADSRAVVRQLCMALVAGGVTHSLLVLATTTPARVSLRSTALCCWHAILCWAIQMLGQLDATTVAGDDLGWQDLRNTVTRVAVRDRDIVARVVDQNRFEAPGLSDPFAAHPVA